MWCRVAHNIETIATFIEELLGQCLCAHREDQQILILPESQLDAEARQ